MIHDDWRNPPGCVDRCQPAPSAEKYDEAQVNWEVSMPRVFALGALMGASVFAVMGCVPIPLPRTELSVVFGSAFTEDKLRTFALPGQSRLAVLERLGAPAYNLGSGRVFVYPWTIDKGTLVFLPLIPYAPLLGTAWAESSLFIVVFDVEGRVLRTGNSTIPLYTSVSGAVRKWMVGQGLDGFKPRQQDVGTSAIVVYRRKSPPCVTREHRVDPYSPFPPPVVLDAETVGDLLKGEYLHLAVAPGQHTVSVDAVPAFRTHEFERLVPVNTVSSPSSLGLEVGSGQTVHVESWLCLVGSTPQRYQMYLEIRDAEQARAALADLKSSWP